MKILNEILKESYIRDEIKSYKQNKIKFDKKHENLISTDIINVFLELNKLLNSSFNNTITSKKIIFKQITGNNTRKELRFVVDVNGKEKTIETSFKEKDLNLIVKKLKSTLSININEFDDKIHKSNKLLIFLDFEEIISSLLDYLNIFNKLDIVII